MAYRVRRRGRAGRRRRSPHSRARRASRRVYRKVLRRSMRRRIRPLKVGFRI